MKKPEEYIQRFQENFVSSTGLSKEAKRDFAYLIRVAQRDVVESTLKLTAEKIEINLYIKGQYKGARWTMLKDGDSYNPLEMDVSSKINKKNILSLKDDLFKEINKE